MSENNAIKYITAVAGIGAATALVWYLLRDEPLKEDSADKVLKILGQIQQSQSKMKEVMKDLTKNLLAKDLNFQQTYDLVKATQPTDPLEEHGITMQQFDALLDETQNDARVRDKIGSIMANPNPQEPDPEAARIPPGLTVTKLVEVHGFMLEELQKLVKDFHKMSNKSTYAF